MAGGDIKGWMSGGMKFAVGDDGPGGEEAKAPLLPLRLLVVADLVPRAPHNAGASAPDGAVRIDPARFDELFATLRPRIALDVPSVLHEGRTTRVDLAPSSLKSFRPDGLCAEVPLLRALLDGRLVLERLREGQITPEQARVELERLWNGSPFVREVLGLLPQKAGRSGPDAPIATSTSVDALLDLVDTGAPAPAAPRAAAPTPAAQGKFTDLIASVARSARLGSGGGVRPTEAVLRVEKAIGAQIGAILQHPEVRRLEQVWRGLRFLTERTKGHSEIRVEVVSARPDDAAAALERAIRTSASAEPPVSCAIVDVALDGTAVAWTRLEAIADAAEARTVPVIVNGVAKLLGLPDLAGVERLDNKGALFQAPHQAPWRAASAKPAMRWVTIAMNGVLARAPYDKASSRVREAQIHELPDDDGAFVWIEPAYVVGALILASFRDTGWPCRIVGARSGGVVENLPVRELGGILDGAEGMAIPTEAFISTDTQRELAKSGVLALASAPNSDAVCVMSAPTAYVTPPKKTYDSASTTPELRLDRAPLGDQLFVARLVQFLRTLCARLPAGSDPAEVQPVIEGALWALFESATPASLSMTVKVEAKGDGAVAAVVVRPHRFLGVSLEEIAVEVALG